MAWREEDHPRDDDGKFTDGNGTYRQNSLEPYKLSSKPLSLKLPDEQLPHSVGAKWRNEDILLVDDTIAHFVEGTKLQNKEVFAGKGVKRQIDDIERLVKQYPGTSAGGWMKVKATATVVLPDNEITSMEVHWYEHEVVGKKEFKEKG